MIRILILSTLAILLVGCGVNDPPTQSEVAPQASEAASSAVTPEPLPAETSPTLDQTDKQMQAVWDPIEAFDKVVEKYQGKQIPVDIHPDTQELVYLPIELIQPQAQMTDNIERPYVGIIDIRVPNTGQNSVYIFSVTYSYQNGQWKYESATQELQGGGQDKVFEKPLFTPELLK